MKNIVAKRIKSARILAGLSYRELSEKMDPPVSHTALSRYEKEEMMPNSKVLISLAKALNVKPDYFFMPFSVEIENVEFRKRSILPVKLEESLKQMVTDQIARYLEVEQFLKISSIFHNPIAKIMIKSGDDVEKAAEKLNDAWGLGYNGITNVFDMLEDHEIKIIEIDAPEVFDGLCGKANGVIPVIVINKNFSIERKRFTALHELGHLLLSFAKDLNPKTIEKYCHWFAGALLIPKQSMYRELGEFRRNIMPMELIPIKETFGISMQAIIFRAANLEIIEESVAHRFWLWINQDPDRKKEIGYGAFQGHEHSDRFKQLVYRAAAEEIISLSKAANLCNQKLADFREQFMMV